MPEGDTIFRAARTLNLALAGHIVTRFECRLDGTPVFAAVVYPAVAANPYFAFALRAERSGSLVFTWEGDRGFQHRETAALEVT